MNSNSDSINVAIQHLRAGELSTAEPIFRQILREQPNHLDALHLLGILLSQSERFTESEEMIRTALAISPNSSVLHGNLGLVVKGQGKINEAIDCYRKALLLNPNDAVANNNLGAIYEEQSNLDDAIVRYQRAVAIDPNYFAAINNLATALLKRSRFEESIASYQQALRKAPEDSAIHNNLGAAYEGNGQLNEAIASYRRAIQIKPEHAGALNNLGNALQKQNNLAEAAACYQHALKIMPGYVTAQSNLGTVFQKQNKLDDAIACYQKALQLQSDWSHAQYNLGLAWLLKGNLAAAWPQYEWRIKVNGLPVFNQPRWDGSPLRGRRILLVAEQGLGDTLQFVRYALLVKACGGRVIVACQPSLMKLLKYCPGIDEFAAQPKSSDDPLPDFDVYLHFLSIPYVLGTTVETIPNRVPYLNADPQLVEEWRRSLEGCHELKVGIAWQGNRLNPVDQLRSMPLVAFEPLGDIDGIRLISLQKGDGSEQVRPLMGRLNVTDFTDRMDESTGPFLDTAALIKNLDLVITSDTSVAHLAGAMGIPVWVALPFSPDWRWMLERENSPWYPTMRLFRQKTPGDWADVFSRIAEDLRRFPRGDDASDRASNIGSASRATHHTAENTVLVETSIGELADKITILQIKSARIYDQAKLVNIRRELESLHATFKSSVNSTIPSNTVSTELNQLVLRLKAVNEVLWQIEDDIRDCEHEKDFGSRFVELARSVYRQNDQRAALKRQINELLGSRIIEEKSYRDYDSPVNSSGL